MCAIENGNQDRLDFENGPRCHQRRISHKRTSLTKKKLIEMMVKHDVEYIDLPITDSRLEHANDENEAIEDRGDCIRIAFDPDEQQQTASKSRPFVGNTHELKVAFVTYLKENRPDLLDCRAEKTLHEHGHKVLWTRLSDRNSAIQPIELFWAACKNHAALKLFHKEK